MTPGDRQLFAGFLNAALGHHPATGSTWERDVRLAFACVTGHGCDETALGDFTALLNGTPMPPPLPAGHGPNHVDNAGHVVSACVPGECITCHGHVDAAGVFHPAKAAS